MEDSILRIIYAFESIGSFYGVYYLVSKPILVPAGAGIAVVLFCLGTLCFIGSISKFEK